MFKILYVEDDRNLSQTISEFLEESGYEVVSAYGVEETFTHLYTTSFDLLLLDVNLPDGDGFSLLKELRDASIDIPTIFTTTLDDIESLDKGYGVGADDYLRKPFVLKELLHRINTLLKRSFNLRQNTLKIADNLIFHLEKNILYKEHKVIHLKQKELLLLKLFIKYKNEVIPLEKFYETLWNIDEVYSEASLRTYIKNLRKIVGKTRIQNVKKQGYRFVF